MITILDNTLALTMKDIENPGYFDNKLFSVLLSNYWRLAEIETPSLEHLFDLSESYIESELTKELAEELIEEAYAYAERGADLTSIAESKALAISGETMQMSSSALFNEVKSILEFSNLTCTSYSSDSFDKHFNSPQVSVLNKKINRSKI